MEATRKLEAEKLIKFKYDQYQKLQDKAKDIKSKRDREENIRKGKAEAEMDKRKQLEDKFRRKTKTLISGHNVFEPREKKSSSQLQVSDFVSLSKSVGRHVPGA